MSRSLVLMLALSTPATPGDAPPDPASADRAARAWAITDAVLARHVDPPTRQQMLLDGLKALAKESHRPIPAGLAARVSGLTGPDQLAALMAEKPGGPRPVDPDSRDAFFDGLLSAVPGSASLMSAKERKVHEQIEGNLYVGIQVALGTDDGDDKEKRPKFLQVLEGGPAEHAGAKAGDVIEEIDGASTEGMPIAEVVDRLRGEEGTDVVVRFRRPQTGEVFTKPMTRGRLPRATVEGLGRLPDGRVRVRLDDARPIGYLKVTEVAGSTPQEFRAFAERLESEGIKALVIDLRGVREARFHPTVLLADALLDGGTIGRVRSVDGQKTYRAEPDALFRGWPIVTIVDPVAPPEVAWLGLALADNKRATVLGDSRVAEEPYLRETISLPGGEWSVRLPTGVLERGDGQPLARLDPKDQVRVALRQFDVKQAQQAINNYLAVDPPGNAPPVPPSPGFGNFQGDLLKKARVLLEDALKAVPN